MHTLTRQELLEAGVHYGHLSKRWNPDFKPFLFMKQGKRHIINLDATLSCLTSAGEAMKKLTQAGKKILFVGCKKQAKNIIEETAQELNQPYVTEKWLGGMLTNFRTIKQLLRKLMTLDQKKDNPAYIHLTKKEKLILERKQKHLSTLLQGITMLRQLPGAIFLVDVLRESTAVKEANKLNIPIFAILDSNASHVGIAYPIPGNDDRLSSIQILVKYLASYLAEGNKLREIEKEKKNQARIQHAQQAAEESKKEKSAQTADKPTQRQRIKQKPPTTDQKIASTQPSSEESKQTQGNNDG